MATTRLTPAALPGRPYGSFAGKQPASAGPKPSDRVTQLMPCGGPGRLYGSFAGKGAAPAPIPTPTPAPPPSTGGGNAIGGWHGSRVLPPGWFDRDDAERRERELLDLLPRRRRHDARRRRRTRTPMLWVSGLADFHPQAVTYRCSGMARLAPPGAPLPQDHARRRAYPGVCGIPHTATVLPHPLGRRRCHLPAVAPCPAVCPVVLPSEPIRARVHESRPARSAEFHRRRRREEALLLGLPAGDADLLGL